MRWRATMCYVRISLLPGGKALRIKDAGDSRVARKRAKYALGASRQTSGRRKMKIWRWRRQGGAGRLVCEPFRCWSQTRQERETRRNAEGVRPVALLKVVAKC